MKKTKDLLKKQEEIKEKVFTNKKSNNIIEKDYNPLNKDYKGFYEREGLFMKETKDIVLEEMLKGLNLQERVFVEEHSDICKKIYRKGMIDSFNYQNKDGTF